MEPSRGSAPGGPHAPNEVRQRLDPWIRELAGARIDGEIPITEARVNRFIADWLRKSNGPLETARLRLRPGNEIDIDLVLRRPRFVPPVTIKARVVEQPRFPESPVVVLRWRMPALGPLATLVGPAAALFGTPPPWLVPDGDRIVVNVTRLLELYGGGAIVPSFRALRVETHAGMVVVSFQLHLSNPP